MKRLMQLLMEWLLPEQKERQMPNFHGLSMRQALKIMEQQGLNVKLQGSGRAIEQNPRPGSVIGGNDQVWIRFVPAA